jgi:hypothetical protein
MKTGLIKHKYQNFVATVLKVKSLSWKKGNRIPNQIKIAKKKDCEKTTQLDNGAN